MANARVVGSAAVILGIAACVPPVFAQCATALDWIGGERYPGVDGPVGAAMVATIPGQSDDRLIVAGDFSFAGVTAAGRIAAWDGAAWSAPFGSGLDGSVHALAMDGGTLIAAGDFLTAGGVPASHIARYTGPVGGWQALGDGLDGTVNAVAVLSGVVYAGGTFTHAGGLAAPGIAAWDDASQTWSPIGVGGFDSPVLALAAFNGSIYAGGTFTQVDGVPAAGIARWDPIAGAWSAVGTGVSPADVRSLVVVGSTLYAGGHFIGAGGVTSYGAAAWNGSAWSGAGNGLYYRTCIRYNCTNHPYAVGVLGPGPVSGPTLYAATDAGAGATPLLFNFSGGSWPTAGGLASTVSQTPGVTALVPYKGEMYLGGSFSGANAPQNLARLTSGTWGLVTGMDGPVAALVPYGGGLVAVGGFNQADGVALNHVGLWNGASWSPIGGGITSGVTGGAVAEQVTSAAVIGNDLYVSAWPGGVVHWNGSAWSVMYGAGAFGGPPIVAAWGTQIVCGAATGSFVIPEGNASSIGYWTGSAWSPLGEFSGLSGSLEPMATLNGTLYAASYLGVRRITSTTGEWGSVGGSSLGGGAYALVNHNGAIYASVYDSTDGITGWVKKLNGSTWQQLGGVFDTYPLALASAGGDLYALGGFTTIDGVEFDGIARWDGAAWQAVGSGAVGDVLTMAGLNGTICAGGTFGSIGGHGYANFAVYGCTPAVCRADFDGSGTLGVADIFNFLNAWFAGDARSDFDNSGTLAVADIFAFLNAWFAGC
jgi:hypothetical protein